MPDTFRTLVPFFNVMDVDARDGNIWLYGEANGEVMDTGTVLMGFDAGLQMFLQRRYATENHVFPTGAFEFSASGARWHSGPGEAVKKRSRTSSHNTSRCRRVKACTARRATTRALHQSPIKRLS